MTQAFNLAQLANNLNTSGQLDATDGLNGLVANANLASSGTPSSTTFLRGDRTWQTLTQKIGQVIIDQDNVRTTGSTTWSTAPVGTLSSPTGNKFLEVSITPTASTSTIIVMAFASVVAEITNTSDFVGWGLWKNNTGTALVANYIYSTALSWPSSSGVNSGAQGLVSMYTESAGSTSARTYSFYAGINAGTCVINGAAGGAFYSGSDTSTLIAIEVLA